jgi:hypothetical protein
MLLLLVVMRLDLQSSFSGEAHLFGQFLGAGFPTEIVEQVPSDAVGAE